MKEGEAHDLWKRLQLDNYNCVVEPMLRHDGTVSKKFRVVVW